MVRVRVRVGVRVRVMVRGRGRVCILNLSNLIKVAMTSLVSCTWDSYPLNDHQWTMELHCVLDYEVTSCSLASKIYFKYLIAALAICYSVPLIS